MTDSKLKKAALLYVDVLKFVTRNLVASDRVFYFIAYETQLEIAAEKKARREGAKTREEILQRMSELMGTTPEKVQAITNELNQRGITEKATPLLFWKNFYHEQDKAVDTDIRKEAQDFGSYSTFNYKPRGTMGAVADSINHALTKLPSLRNLIRFVNIVVNFANNNIDYTPYGIVRAVRKGPGVS